MFISALILEVIMCLFRLGAWYHLIFGAISLGTILQTNSSQVALKILVKLCGSLKGSI